MASLTKTATGWRIQWTDGAGNRKSLRFGELKEQDAKTMKNRIERLVLAASTGDAPTPELTAWLKTLQDRPYAKLAAVGLVSEREASRKWTLGDLMKAYFDAISVKGSTVTAYRQIEGALVGYFGKDCNLAKIGPMEAEQWARAMRDAGYAQATCSKQVKVARGMFRRGVRWGMIASSPFSELRAGPQSNSERSVFVPRDVIAKVLAACPDSDWRCIVALTRFAGLRTPSETLALRWCDVDWHAKRLRVRSPKTEHHEGGAVRYVPIAPELMEQLEVAFEQAAEGAEFVVSGYRSSKANLRTHLERILSKAGVEQWPRLYHNMRASVQTEWAAVFPLADVCKWIGNTVAVASKHYLQSNDANFDAATRLAIGGAKSGALVVQNGVKSANHQSGAIVKETPQTLAACTIAQNEKSPDTSVKGPSMGATGIEQSQQPTGKTHVSDSGGANSGANGVGKSVDSIPIGEREERLLRVVKAWDTLPEHVRQTIIAIVDASTPAPKA